MKNLFLLLLFFLSLSIFAKDEPKKTDKPKSKGLEEFPVPPKTLQNRENQLVSQLTQSSIAVAELNTEAQKIKAIFGNLENNGNILSAVNASSLQDLPVAVQMTGSKSIMLIKDAHFYPTYAELEVYVRLTIGEDEVFFGNKKVKYSLNLGFLGEANLEMLGNQEFANTQYKISLNTTPSDKCFLKINCGKLEGLVLEGKFTLNTDIYTKLSEKGYPEAGDVSATIEETITDLSKINLNIKNLSPFALKKSYNNLGYIISSASIDLSETQSIDGSVDFLKTQIFKNKNETIEMVNQWTGIFAKDLIILLPIAFNNTSKIDLDNKNVVARHQIEASNIALDATGLYFKYQKKNVFTKSQIGGLAFDLNNINCDMDASKFKKFEADGSMANPFALNVIDAEDKSENPLPIIDTITVQTAINYADTLAFSMKAPKGGGIGFFGGKTEPGENSSTKMNAIGGTFQVAPMIILNGKLNIGASRSAKGKFGVSEGSPGQDFSGFILEYENVQFGWDGSWRFMFDRIALFSAGRMTTLPLGINNIVLSYVKETKELGLNIDAYIGLMAKSPKLPRIDCEIAFKFNYGYDDKGVLKASYKSWDLKKIAIIGQIGPLQVGGFLTADWQGEEYKETNFMVKGEVSVKAPAFPLAPEFSSRFIFGNSKLNYTFLFIDALVFLPVGIPIGPTGFQVNGFGVGFYMNMKKVPGQTSNYSASGCKYEPSENNYGAMAMLGVSDIPLKGKYAQGYAGVDIGISTSFGLMDIGVFIGIKLGAVNSIVSQAGVTNNMVKRKAHEKKRTENDKAIERYQKIQEDYKNATTADAKQKILADNGIITPTSIDEKLAQMRIKKEKLAQRTKEMEAYEKELSDFAKKNVNTDVAIVQNKKTIEDNQKLIETKNQAIIDLDVKINAIKAMPIDKTKGDELALLEKQKQILLKEKEDLTTANSVLTTKNKQFENDIKISKQMRETIKANLKTEQEQIEKNLNTALSNLKGITVLKGSTELNFEKSCTNANTCTALFNTLSPADKVKYASIINNVIGYDNAKKTYQDLEINLNSVSDNSKDIEKFLTQMEGFIKNIQTENSGDKVKQMLSDLKTKLKGEEAVIETDPVKQKNEEATIVLGAYKSEKEKINKEITDTKALLDARIKFVGKLLIEAVASQRAKLDAHEFGQMHLTQLGDMTGRTIKEVEQAISTAQIVNGLNVIKKVKVNVLVEPEGGSLKTKIKKQEDIYVTETTTAKAKIANAESMRNLLSGNRDKAISLVKERKALGDKVSETIIKQFEAKIKILNDAKAKETKLAQELKPLEKTRANANNLVNKAEKRLANAQKALGLKKNKETEKELNDAEVNVETQKSALTTAQSNVDAKQKELDTERKIININGTPDPTEFVRLANEKNAAIDAKEKEQNDNLNAVNGLMKFVESSKDKVLVLKDLDIQIQSVQVTLSEIIGTEKKKIKDGLIADLNASINTFIEKEKYIDAFLLEKNKYLTNEKLLMELKLQAEKGEGDFETEYRAYLQAKEKLNTLELLYKQANENLGITQGALDEKSDYGIAKKDIENTQTEIDTYSKNIAANTKDVDKLKALLSANDDIKSLIVANNFDGAKNLINSKKNNLEPYKTKIDNYATLKAKDKKSEAEIKALKTLRTSLNAEINIAGLDVDNTTNALAKIEKKRGEFDKMLGDLDLLIAKNKELEQNKTDLKNKETEQATNKTNFEKVKDKYKADIEGIDKQSSYLANLETFKNTNKQQIEEFIELNDKDIEAKEKLLATYPVEQTILETDDPSTKITKTNNNNKRYLLEKQINEAKDLKQKLADRLKDFDDAKKKLEELKKWAGLEEKKTAQAMKDLEFALAGNKSQERKHELENELTELQRRSALAKTIYYGYVDAEAELTATDKRAKAQKDSTDALNKLTDSETKERELADSENGQDAEEEEYENVSTTDAFITIKGSAGYNFEAKQLHVLASGYSFIDHYFYTIRGERSVAGLIGKVDMCLGCEDKFHLWAGTPGKPLGMRMIFKNTHVMDGLEFTIQAYIIAGGMPKSQTDLTRSYPNGIRKYIEKLKTEKKIAFDPAVRMLEAYQTVEFGGIGIGFAVDQFQPNPSDFGIFSVKINRGIALDLLLANQNAVCEAAKPINGFYGNATGVLYGNGELLAKLDLFGVPLTFPLFRGEAGLVGNTGFGNGPEYIEGNTNFEVSLLSGIVKFSVGFNFGYGQPCKKVDLLANGEINVITGAYRGKDDNIILKTNQNLGKQFTVTIDNENYEGVALIIKDVTTTGANPPIFFTSYGVKDSFWGTTSYKDTYLADMIKEVKINGKIKLERTYWARKTNYSIAGKIVFAQNNPKWNGNLNEMFIPVKENEFYQKFKVEFKTKDTDNQSDKVDNVTWKTLK